MSKQELRILYKQGKLTAKEYFKRYAEIIKSECSFSPVPVIFDGKLPLYETK